MGQGAEMPHPDRPPPPGFLASAGELGRLIEAFDWSATPLGALDAWPQSLRTSVSLILNARHPMWIGWGKEATFLYNDAYVDVLGAAKHPWALGRPAGEVWSEIWDVCGPLADKVFQHAEATSSKRLGIRFPTAPSSARTGRSAGCSVRRRTSARAC